LNVRAISGRTPSIDRIDANEQDLRPDSLAFAGVSVLISSFYSNAKLKSDNPLFDAFHEQYVPGERGPDKTALYTSVIEGEFPDLCLKTGVLFLLTVLSHQILVVSPPDRCC